MKKNALITGVQGQDGSYLAKLLLEKKYKVYGMRQNNLSRNFENTDYLGVTDKIDFVVADITNEKSINRIIKSIKPKEVYNFAAQSFVGSSWEKAKLTTEVNALGTLYLLNALKKYSPETRFYQASTSEMFGNSSENGILTEKTSFHPRSPYAISKLYAYWITNNFKESYGMFCANGILFNHESPIRGKEFVTRKISYGVAGIKLGLNNVIKLGNLDSRRDWGFAGDYVEAMYLILQHDKPDNYIVSTGVNHSVKDFLDIAFDYVGIKDWGKYIKIDPAFKRPTELFTLLGKSNKAHQILGWKPKVKFEDLVKMMVDADLERLTKSKKYEI